MKIDLDKMSPEEALKALSESGFPTGSWSPPEDKTSQDEPKRVQPEFIRKQVELLKNIARLAEKQIEKDKVEIARSHEELNRLKHGSGR